MSDAGQVVVLRIAEQRYALRLEVVERAIRALEICPLPGAPSGVLGVVNIAGRLIPVYDLRSRFGLPDAPIELSDQIVLARTVRRPVALVVNAVEGVEMLQPEQWVGADEVLPGLAYVDGVLKFPDGLVLIHDLEQFLSPTEQSALDQALSRE
jgi:purine-binding chemotaxis protein CheW